MNSLVSYARTLRICRGRVHHKLNLINLSHWLFYYWHSVAVYVFFTFFFLSSVNVLYVKFLWNEFWPYALNSASPIFVVASFTSAGTFFLLAIVSMSFKLFLNFLTLTPTQTPFKSLSFVCFYAFSWISWISWISSIILVWWLKINCLLQIRYH